MVSFVKHSMGRMCARQLYRGEAMKSMYIVKDQQQRPDAPAMSGLDVMHNRVSSHTPTTSEHVS